MAEPPSFQPTHTATLGCVPSLPTGTLGCVPSSSIGALCCALFAFRCCPLLGREDFLFVSLSLQGKTALACLVRVNFKCCIFSSKLYLFYRNRRFCYKDIYFCSIFRG